MGLGGGVRSHGVSVKEGVAVAVYLCINATMYLL